MSVHVEWSSASGLAFEYVAAGEFEDEYGSKNDKPALLIETDSIFVVEGTPGEIRSSLYRALAAVSEAEAGS